MDFTFLDKIFQMGVLEFFDSISVHPYRQKLPETAATDFRTLRRFEEKLKNTLIISKANRKV